MKKILLSAVLLAPLFSCSNMDSFGDSDSTQLYDLAAVSVDCTAVSVNAQTLISSGSAAVTVENTGIVNLTKEFSIYVFEDTNNNGSFDDGTDYIIGTATASTPLAVGDSSIFSVTCSGAVSFPGSRLCAIINPDNLLKETNTANNTVSVAATADYSAPAATVTPVLENSWTDSTTQTGAYEVIGQIVCAHLTDDNEDGVINAEDVPDLIFITYNKSLAYLTNGYIRAIRGDTGEELFTITGYTHSGWENLACGDIDNDGKNEIVAVTGGKTVVAYSNTGALKWQSAVIACNNYPTITLADLNHDGAAEIIVGNIVLSNTGTVKWTGANNAGYYTGVAADLDCSGEMEIISGNTAYRYNGTIYWNNTALPPSNNIAIGNFDGDTYPEIVLAGSSNVYLLEHDGTVKWGPLNIAGSGSVPCIADVDGDGEAEIAITSSSQLSVLEADGTVKWTSAIKDLSSGSTGAAAFDFNNDGKMELVLNDETALRIYDGSTGTVLSTIALGSGTFFEAPVIADVDNDAHAEIVASASTLVSPDTNHGIFIFGAADNSWPDTLHSWNQQAYCRDNVTDTGSIPSTQAYGWQTHNSFRVNPVVSRTGSFELCASYPRFEKLSDTSALLTVRIGNACSDALTRSIFVSFYNGDPAAGGTLIGRAPFNAGLSGYSYTDFSFTWSSLPTGSLQLFMSVDDDGTGRDRIREIDETNNTVSLTITN